MEKRLRSHEELARQVLCWVAEQVKQAGCAVPVGVSNRHIHLDRADMDALFGPGSELTVKKPAGQPGQYAAEETVTLRGPKGELRRVRVLGPLRSETQAEISVGDGYVLGINPPIRDSGMISGTPGIEIIGPKGTVQKGRGVIVAKRHIHMTPAQAQQFGLKDGQLISVDIGGERGGRLNQVLIRVSDKFALEMHIDVEEANAIGAKNGDSVYMVLP